MHDTNSISKSYYISKCLRKMRVAFIYLLDTAAKYARSVGSALGLKSVRL